MYRSHLLDIPGAVADETTGVPLHYGDPLREQRELAGAFIDRSHRAVVTVTGPDAPEFLNNLLSQKLDSTPATFASAALDLDAQGRILHHVDVLRNDGTFYLDTPPEQHDSLVGYLTRMVFWSQVEIADAELAVVSQLIDATGTPTPVPAALTAARHMPFGAYTRVDSLVPREALASVAELGAPLAGLMAYDAARVRAGEPELHRDLDEKAIPHEVPRFITRGGTEWPGAVHLAKGCYRGQETVARVENLGQSPRLLVMVQLDGASISMPEPGATITANGRKVGRLGTVVHDAEYGPIALALMKRSALGAALNIDGTAASVDADSLPAVEGERAGRRAVDRLRGRDA